MLHGTGELELIEEAAISLLDKFSCLLKPVSRNVSRLRPSHFLPSVNTMSLNLPVTCQGKDIGNNKQNNSLLQFMHIARSGKQCRR